MDLTLRVLAVTRLALPWAHLPATTALGTADPEGRQKALRCGANVVMPNVGPTDYRQLYQTYPGKICVNETVNPSSGGLTPVSPQSVLYTVVRPGSFTGIVETLLEWPGCRLGQPGV